MFHVAKFAEGPYVLHAFDKVTRGSGNVFTDLAFPPDEAANLQLRSDLIIQLRKRLATLGATQTEWAEILGVAWRDGLHPTMRRDPRRKLTLQSAFT